MYNTELAVTVTVMGLPLCRHHHHSLCVCPSGRKWTTKTAAAFIAQHLRSLVTPTQSKLDGFWEVWRPTIRCVCECVCQSVGLAVRKRCKANTSLSVPLSFSLSPVDSTKRLNLARRCLSLSLFSTHTNRPSNVNFHTIHQEECGASATEGGKQLVDKKNDNFFAVRNLDQIKLWENVKNYILAMTTSVPSTHFRWF